MHPDEISQAEVRSEVQDYLSTREQRRHIFPRALLVGILAGAVAIAFRAVLALGDNLRGNLLAFAHHATFGWTLPILFSSLTAVLSVYLVRKFAPEAAGSGIPHLEAVLRGFRTLRGPRVLLVKFLGGMLAISSGLALGREGPTVQMGAAVADIVGTKLHVSPTERRTLLAAGAGAGLAAAFNAPLSGLIFVLEEIQRDFRPIAFGAAFVAAAAADIIARSFTGQLPVFMVPAYPVPPLGALPIFLLLGLVVGWFGILFNESLLRNLNIFGRVPPRYTLLLAALVGIGVGIIGWFEPAALGGGHSVAEEAMAGHIALVALPLWFIVRFTLTMVSYSTGAPGGIFAPLLAIGALLGLGVGLLTHLWVPAMAPHPEIFAVVGMAAYFTAIVRAPLTGIVLILEMTGNYGQMLPLVVACFTAYIVAEYGKTLPIYEALLERDLSRGGHEVPRDTTLVREFTVQPGSPFDGIRVREMGLPAGCILVAVRDAEREWVPSGNTRLKADDILTAIIAPEVVEPSLSLLQHGCQG
jgi:CIC family chloride channel protein